MLTIRWRELASAVGTLCDAVPYVSPKGADTATLFVADGRVVLRLETYHLRVEYSLGAADGDTVCPVPLRRLADLLAVCRCHDVELRQRKAGLVVKTAEGAFVLACGLPEDVDEPVPTPSGQTTILPGEEFRLAVQRTVFATDTKSTRYGLGGVLLDEEDGCVVFVATDSWRMAIAQTAVPATGLAKTLLPVDLLRIGSGPCEEEVRIAADKEAVLLTVGPLTVAQRALPGRFPQWRYVPPTKIAATASMSGGELELRLAWFLATLTEGERSRSCGLDFSLSPGLLTLTRFEVECDDDATAKERARTTVAMPVDYTGEPRVVRFDPRFVRDFLGPGRVDLDLPPDECACVWRSGDDYRYVLMPQARPAAPQGGGAT